ncbi:MAG: SH3 domain-containing protein, partial [Clostridia bacterium]|nr:SH3 domain-containing protein [Clostridia bacterium]
GTAIAAEAVDGKWYRVTYNGQTGYVMTSFLHFSAAAPVVTAAPAAVVTAPPQAGVSGLTAVVVCDDGGKLNLRRTPASGGAVLERIPNGTLLSVYAVDGRWYATSYNGQTGYVLGSFLAFGAAAATPTPVPAAVVTAPPAVGVANATVVCSDGGSLNLRQTPATNGKVLDRIPNGTAIAAEAVDGKWYRVTYNGQTGYVMAKYLQVSNTATGSTAGGATAAAPVSPVVTVTVNELQYGEFRYATVRTSSGSLNVRKGPGTTYARVSEIKNGTQIVISSIEGEWCAMYYGDIQGYVQRQYLNIQAASTAPAQAAPAASTYDTSSLTRVLRAGYTGADVTVVQQRLKDLGYLSSLSGSYDSATQEAVRSYQKKNGLTADGLAGPSTFSSLFSDGALTAGSTLSGSYNTYVMDYNGNTSSAKTSAVRKAQQALRALNYNVPLTGAFEARTHDAIVAFQLRNGITASGVLDAATQTALYSGSAHDAASPARYYLPSTAGRGLSAPISVELLHWNNDVKAALSGQKSVTAYDPNTGLSWKLNILSRGRHLDVEPATLEDTMIQKKSFVTTSWDVHPVYILLPDGRWSLATMHDYPHGANTIMNNGFGGQNCVHFLRDMSEAKQNDPSYGVQNQEVLRSTWYSMTGVQITN